MESQPEKSKAPGCTPNRQCPRLALLQLDPAIRRLELQFSSPAAHRPGERLGAKRSLYSNRKVRANPAIGGGGIHLEFRGSRQGHVHTAIGGQELQLAAPLGIAHGHAHATVGGLRRGPLAGGHFHIAVRRVRLHHALQVHAMHRASGGLGMEEHAVGYLHGKVDLGAMAMRPVAGLRRHAAAMAAPRGLLFRVYGANRDTIRVLDNLDEQFVVVVVATSDARHAGGFPGSAVRSNLSVGIEHFQRLPGLQVPLPMKIGWLEDRALFALRSRGRTRHQRDHRQTHRAGYPAPYETFDLVHDSSLPDGFLTLEPPCSSHAVPNIRSSTHFGSEEKGSGWPGRNPRERFWVPGPRFCEGGSFFFWGLFFLAQRGARRANVRQGLSGVKCKCSITQTPSKQPPRPTLTNPRVGHPTSQTEKQRQNQSVQHARVGIKCRLGGTRYDKFTSPGGPRL